MNSPGTLYICATPIGNMEDVTLRVLRVLRDADFIAAEDTRRTLKLLNHYGIHTPLVSLHEHNERNKAPFLLEKIMAGQNAALVSDAGMPAVSDPGAFLIRACRAAGAGVSICPGASAGVSALVLLGIGGGYVFQGFPPDGKKGLSDFFARLKRETLPTVIYEAPHRLVRTLKAARGEIGERRAHIAREITKIYEEAREGTLSELIAHYEENAPRGEFVVIIAGAESAGGPPDAAPGYPSDIAGHVAGYVAEGMTEKEAMRKAAAERGVARRDVYRALKIEAE
jgi:16S rRNA (cytidine1402-2'-O)-methyltransferase